MSWEVEDQFLFGSDVLVAPVYTDGARERRVYLPEGATWRDAWSGAEHEGGQWVTAPAPLELIPVFLRADGTVPPFGAFADLASAAPSASPVDSSTADGRSGE